MAQKKINFSEDYEEFEKIVADFESRDLDLEKDIPRFERGLELAHLLKQRLKEIDNKVKAIEQKFDSADSDD